jgi:hypothetical protein
MEPHQRLTVFLPKLRAALVHIGFSKEEADSVCNDIRAGRPPKPISTASHYHRAWVICDAMEDILTTLDDGSEAAAWCQARARLDCVAFLEAVAISPPPGARNVLFWQP